MAAADALTDEVRRRFETRSPVHAARGEQRDILVSEEPTGCLRGVAGVSVLRQQHDQTTLQLLVERRQDERQDGLGDASARRQRCGELLEPLLRAEAFDEAVENGTVHDDGPNEAFGRVAMVRGQSSLRAPS